MRLFKVFFILTIILNILVFCSPPPELPLKEEIIENIYIKGDYNKEDVSYFLKFFKEMQEAAKLKDYEKAFSFYSKDFMSDAGKNLENMKKNTKLLYKNYDKINYTMTDIKIHIKGDEAVSTDNYTYSAKPIVRGYKPLDYEGKERIYWRKENGGWKIINWVLE